MRLSELSAREDVQSATCETLQRHLPSILGASISVVGDPSAPGQEWRENRLLSAYHVGVPGNAVARHLRDEFRVTPRRFRAPAQFVVGTLAGTRAGLLLTSKPAFRIYPPIGDAASWAIVPGNRRVRLFDFAAMRSYSLLKERYSASTNDAELSVRYRAPPGPFPPIVRVGPDRRWFEEPLIDGRSLPRVAGAARRRNALQKATAALAQWRAGSVRSVDATAYSSKLLRIIREAASNSHRSALEPLGPRLLEMSELWNSLVSRSGEVSLMRTHGDFQPGNVLVPRGEGRPLIIDWEYEGERSQVFDGLTLGLSTRSPTGLRQRTQNWLVNGKLVVGNELLPALPSPTERARAFALFLLEEVVWYIEGLGESERPSALVSFLDQCPPLQGYS